MRRFWPRLMKGSRSWWNNFPIIERFSNAIRMPVLKIEEVVSRIRRLAFLALEKSYCLMCFFADGRARAHGAMASRNGGSALLHLQSTAFSMALIRSPFRVTEAVAFLALIRTL